MSSQDRAAKARDKAFRKASARMRERTAYETPEDYAWDLIWDRALRYADRWWDEQLAEVREHLAKARGEAMILALDLNQAQEAANVQADEVARLRIENDRLKGQISNQMGLLGASRATSARLRGQRDELKVAMAELAPRVHSVSLDQVVSDLDAKTRELTLANLRVTNLRRRLDTAEAQLAEARALTTQGTTTVFDENERLVAEVHRLTSLLADEEEKVTYLKDLNNRLHVDLAVARVQARRKVD